jgi:hypothetical protein
MNLRSYEKVENSRSFEKIISILQEIDEFKVL